jgi:probable F420-dependent oxidoreductase
MKFDITALSASPATAGDEIAAAEALGCDGWFLPETHHDPFIVAALAIPRSTSVDVGTGIAVAFARSPMTLAYSANDLQQLSGGRFVLGLGSQVKAHIERRFSMPWSQPAARMREFIAALRAIWTAWLEESTLDFRGDFYQHRLMTPFFAGTRHEFGPPRIGLAAVGPRMTEVAGETADLLFCNPLTSAEYLQQETLPALAAGALSAGRDQGDIDVSVGVFVVTGHDEAERARVDRATRAQIAFYASTPTYRPVLETHGWGDLQPALQGLARDGRWDDMADRIDDEMLRTFAIVVDDPSLAGPAIVNRFGKTASRVYLYEIWRPAAVDLHAIRDAVR